MLRWRWTAVRLSFPLQLSSFILDTGICCFSREQHQEYHPGEAVWKCAVIWVLLHNDPLHLRVWPFITTVDPSGFLTNPALAWSDPYVTLPQQKQLSTLLFQYLLIEKSFYSSLFCCLTNELRWYDFESFSSIAVQPNGDFAECNSFVNPGLPCCGDLWNFSCQGESCLPCWFHVILFKSNHSKVI